MGDLRRCVCVCTGSGQQVLRQTGLSERFVEAPDYRLVSETILSLFSVIYFNSMVITDDPD